MLSLELSRFEPVGLPVGDDDHQPADKSLQRKAFRERKGENKAIEGGLRTRESPVWGGTFLGEAL